MSRRLFKLYQRKRIININVNIVVAGLVAVALSKFPVHWMSQAIGPGLQWLKAILAALIDASVDVALYFVLHWVANHWRPLKAKTEKERRTLEADPGSFWKEATLIQAERYLLSPIFYIIAMSLLCSHLSHGVQAMFQTLGWRSQKTAGLLDKLSLAYAAVIWIGFVSIPASILIFQFGR